MDKLIYILIFIFAFLPENLWSYVSPLGSTPSIMNVVIIILFLFSFLVFIIMRGKKLILTPLMVLIFIFFGGELLYGILQKNSYNYILKDFFGLIIMLYIQFIQVNYKYTLSRMNLQKAINIFLIGYFMHISLVLIFSIVVGQIITLNQNYIYLAFFLSMISFIYYRKSRYLFLCLIFFFSIFIRAKRVVLILLLIFLLLPLYFLKGKRKIYYLLLLMISMIIIINILPGNLYLFERFNEFTQLRNSFDVKFYLYAIEMFFLFFKQESIYTIFWGGGLGKELNINFYLMDLHSNYFIDNLYTTTIYKLGLIGIILVFVFYTTLLKRSFSSIKHFNGFYRWVSIGIFVYFFIDFILTPIGLGIFYNRTIIPILFILLILNSEVNLKS